MAIHEEVHHSFSPHFHQEFHSPHSKVTALEHSALRDAEVHQS